MVMVKRSPGKVKNLHFSVSSRSVLGPTQLPIRLVLWVIFPEKTRPRPETDHPLPTDTEVKKTYVYTYTPPILLHGIVVI
jgi:hypothetical protein